MSDKRYQVQCRHFSGYKPCQKSQNCDDLCSFKDIPTNRIVLIHLGAIGAVVRSTSLLAAIKDKYPSSHITWITQKPSDSLLKDHPRLDRVLTTSTEDIMIASMMSYDVVICVDKSLTAIAIAKQLKTKKLLGFTCNENGAIIPANFKAKELWELGLDNTKKFYENQKPETQLMIEAFDLNYQRQEYDLPLTEKELKIATHRKNSWTLSGDEIFVGINTGCSSIIPYKKLPFEAYVELIEKIQSTKNMIPILLGGPEDQERNEKLHLKTGALLSPCNKGLRDGLISVACCDIVVSGDSLGMHMAISQKKWVVAWFGPTCEQEIDLYDRGQKILTKASCSPCWKRECNKPTMCYDLVSLDEIFVAVLAGKDYVLKNSSNPAIYL